MHICVHIQVHMCVCARAHACACVRVYVYSSIYRDAPSRCCRDRGASTCIYTLLAEISIQGNCSEKRELPALKHQHMDFLDIHSETQKSLKANRHTKQRSHIVLKILIALFLSKQSNLLVPF